MRVEIYGVESELFGAVEPWVAGVLVIVIGAIVFVVLAWVTRRGGG